MPKRVKLMVSKAALRVLDLDRLQVDPAYQRDVKSKHKLIVADFNEEALGIPLVGERDDGSLWIVDGLQRVTALRKLGKRQARCEVFASRGPEHEAEVFKLVNMNRTKLTAGEQFRALLASGDEGAWAIKQAVESVGCKVVLGKSGNANPNDIGSRAAKELMCVSTLVRVHKYHGVEPIKFALRMADAAWPGDRLAVHNDMVGGLATFHARKEGLVDEERLLPRLQGLTAQKVLYAAKQASLASNAWGAVADVLEKVYRKRLPHRRGT